VPWSWLVREGGKPPRSIEDVRARGVRTIYGEVGYTLHARGDSVVVALKPGLRIPPGGIVVIPPSRAPLRHAWVNGVAAPITPEGGVVVRALPARVVLNP